MKIRPVGTELFHAEGRTDRHDEANGRFLQFCVSARLHNRLRRADIRPNKITYSYSKCN